MLNVNIAQIDKDLTKLGLPVVSVELDPPVTDPPRPNHYRVTRPDCVIGLLCSRALTTAEHNQAEARVLAHTPAPTRPEKLAVLRAKRQGGQPLTPAEEKELLDLLLEV